MLTLLAKNPVTIATGLTINLYDALFGLSLDFSYAVASGRLTFNLQAHNPAFYWFLFFQGVIRFN
ncbi:MAG: hypothetical protein QNJ70_21370 [Xenococcaceae cyanobacterium MO_207.B15]|nr:hypothetical protein [Xenococcaceae cyanobacterium MO_207.B15]